MDPAAIMSCLKQLVGMIKNIWRIVDIAAESSTLLLILTKPVLNKQSEQLGEEEHIMRLAQFIQYLYIFRSAKSNNPY